MKRRSILEWVFIALVVYPVMAKGQDRPFGNFRENNTAGIKAIISDIDFRFGPTDAQGLPIFGQSILFPDVTVADIGKTFFVLAESYPALTAMLTDGDLDQAFLSKNSLGRLIPENAFTKTSWANNGYVDFYGCKIVEYGLAVNNLSFDCTSVPDWTFYNWDVTIEMRGAPEPATIFLLGLGGLALLRRRKK